MTHKPRRFDLAPDNFIAGIAGQLTAPELGLYWLICLLIYSHGGPVDYDEKRFGKLLSGTHWRVIQNASKRLQELGKIVVNDGQVMAKGCARPLQEASMRVARALENGSKGGRPPNQNNNISEPDGLQDEKLARVAPSPSPPPSSPEDTSSLRSDNSANAVPASKPAKKTTAQEPWPDVPDWVPSEAWDGFVQNRKAIKHALPPRAAKLILKELDKLRGQGADPAAVLEQSTRNGWRDVFPVRESNARGSPNRPAFQDPNQFKILKAV